MRGLKRENFSSQFQKAVDVSIWPYAVLVKPPHEHSELENACVLFTDMFLHLPPKLLHKEKFHFY